MDKQSSAGFRYVLIMNDNDDDFLTLDPSDDEICYQVPKLIHGKFSH